MDEWVDAPTGSGRWWRRVGDSEPVLCDVTDGEGMNATRVDGVEVLYSARPFAGVKWRRDVPAVTDETTRLHRCAKCGEERSAVESCEGDCYPLCGPCHLELRHEDAAVWRARVDAAERERDDLAATLETRTAEHALAVERVRELEARPEFADRGLKTLTDAGWELATERDRLRAIIEGRTTPPTIAEARAHSHRARGAFVAMLGEGEAHYRARVVTGLQRFSATPQRWIALDADGRPCAWPTAEVSR